MSDLETSSSAPVKAEEIQTLKNAITASHIRKGRKSNMLTIADKVSAHLQETKTREDALHAKMQDLEGKMKKLNNQNTKLQNELNTKETKKLAQAYEDQKKEYKIAKDNWLEMTIGALILHSGSVFTTALFFLHSNGAWHDRIYIYAANIIIGSIGWFCAKNYSLTSNLYSEFANKQAIAQSYSNILETIDDEEAGGMEIKNAFLNKATEVLCSKHSVSQGKKSNLPAEDVLKLLKDVLMKSGS